MPLSQQYRERFDGYFHERRSIAPRFSTASREMMLRPSASKGGVMLHDGTFPGNGLTNRNHGEQGEEHVIGYFGTAASPRGGGDRTSFERLDSFGSAGATKRRCSSPTCSRHHHHPTSNNNNGHTPQQMNLSLGSLSSAGGGGGMGSRFQSFAAGGRKDSFAATNRSSVFSTTTNMLSASHSSVAPHNRSTVFGTSTRKDLWATPDPTTRAKTPPPSTTQRRSSMSSTSRGGGQELTDAYTRLREEAAREQAERTRRYRMEGVHTPRPYTATAPGAPTALQVVGGRAVSPRAGGGVIARSGRIACVPNVAPWDKIARQVALGKPTTPGPGAYQPHYGLV